MDPSRVPDPGPRHKPHVNDRKRPRMRGHIQNPGQRAPSNDRAFVNENRAHCPSSRTVESSEAALPFGKSPGRKYTWHRHQTEHSTANLDENRTEGLVPFRSALNRDAENGPPNDGLFNDPAGSYPPPKHIFKFQRDNCYNQWKQLEAAFNARERHFYLMEEELVKREQAIRTQEQIIAHWRAQAQAERLEAAFIRQEAIALKEQAYEERRKLEEEAKKLESRKSDSEQMHIEVSSMGMANLSDEVASKINDQGRASHFKQEVLQIDSNISERLADESGEDATVENDMRQCFQFMGEITQNQPNTSETDAGQELQSMRDLSQSYVDTPQKIAHLETELMARAELDVSGNNHERFVESMEVCGLPSPATKNLDASENADSRNEIFSDEVVNGVLESPGLCVLNEVALDDSEVPPHKPHKINATQHDHRVLSNVNANDSSLQSSKHSGEGNRMGEPIAFQSLLCKGSMKPEEPEVRLSFTEESKPVSASANFPVKVKAEDFEHEQLIPFVPVLDDFANGALHNVKVKTEAFENYELDELDHLSLEERKKLCTATKLELADVDADAMFPKLECTKAGQCELDEACKQQPKTSLLKRKKRKTKTCSVETALEEDAPGLLEVLREKGVVDEIKLYGDSVYENLIGLAADEDSFEELETVIAKLWGRPSGLLKMGRPRHLVGPKATYCLACLISLIEQTRALQQRKWPVEWGWCRQLQSFIFVFERHNRIVLERPEYGYATYFFELVQSLPIKWQVGRLITVMSIAICGRTAVLENKPLEVGQDLTLEEASILEEYGWTPNSGLGTLLNYCDRVVHDRKNDDDNLDWRSKIGKLLMDGHDRGSILITNVPRKIQNVVSTCKLEKHE